jgi:phospholipase/carboxylesterase
LVVGLVSLTVPLTPTRGARASIDELRHAGCAAELHEYVGLEHDISHEEEVETLGRIQVAADGVATAALAP